MGNSPFSSENMTNVTDFSSEFPQGFAEELWYFSEDECGSSDRSIYHGSYFPIDECVTTYHGAVTQHEKYMCPYLATNNSQVKIWWGTNANCTPDSSSGYSEYHEPEFDGCTGWYEVITGFQHASYEWDCNTDYRSDYVQLEIFDNEEECELQTSNNYGTSTYLPINTCIKGSGSWMNRDSVADELVRSTVVQCTIQGTELGFIYSIWRNNSCPGMPWMQWRENFDLNKRSSCEGIRNNVGHLIAKSISNYSQCLELTQAPTLAPTKAPTLVPSLGPTIAPSLVPSSSPTCEAPYNDTTCLPTWFPTPAPTLKPTTARPTSTPTHVPTNPKPYPTKPMRNPQTSAPTIENVTNETNATSFPTIQNTTTPTAGPSLTPTMRPTSWPTSQPTSQPISQPTTRPTMEPTPIKTKFPTRRHIETRNETVPKQRPDEVLNEALTSPSGTGIHFALVFGFISSLFTAVICALVGITPWTPVREANVRIRSYLMARREARIRIAAIIAEQRMDDVLQEDANRDEELYMAAV